MTRVLVDQIEVQQDGLRFGDPIGCSYHWLEPDQVDAYGDSVRRLAGKVELAVDGFERTATISEEVFAGEAADALRARAAHRHEESATVRDNLRGLGRAINAYSDVLRRHREGLEQLRAYAASQGLEVRDNRIWPPVETIAGDAPQKEARRVGARLEVLPGSASRPRSSCATPAGSSTRELIKALADYAGVHPDKDQAEARRGRRPPGGVRRAAARGRGGGARGGPGRRRAPTPPTARSTALKRREQTRPRPARGAWCSRRRPPAEIQAQADKVAAAPPRAGGGPRRGPRGRGRRRS